MPRRSKASKPAKPGPRSAPSSRPPIERMLFIHEELRSERMPNCTSLAKRLEVSRKTILRDIEFMRDRFGLPIEYVDEDYAYRYTHYVDSFPTVQVSEGEMFALLVAQKAMEQYRGTPLESTLESAFGKIVSGLRDSVSFKPGAAGVSFHNTGASNADIEVFQALSEAVRRRTAVSFVYQKLGDTRGASRLVHPHHLACVQNSWYLIAWDPTRRGMRTFSLSRLSGLRDTGEPFERQAGFDVDRYFANSFGVFSGEGDHLVRIRFTGKAARLVTERFWHSSQSFTHASDGSVELALRLGDLTELEHWILGWGAEARVLEPQSLADRIGTAAAATLRLYAPERG